MATVSRVVNSNYPVNEDTKRKVEKAIEELGYTPNTIARSMKKKKTFTIGLVVPSVTNPYFNQLVEGVTSVATKIGYTVILSISNNSNKFNTIDDLISRRVDGIIFAIGVFDKDIKRIKNYSKKIPLVCINANFENINYVCIDEKKASLKGLECIENKKDKNVLLIRGGKDSPSYNIKEELYKKAFDKHYILNIENGNVSEAINYSKSVCKDFFTKNKNITDIIACNDLMAIGAIKALNELNIEVPKDVKVIGFDNIIYGTLIKPTLTTVDQKPFELGSVSCKKLIELSDKKIQNVQIIIEPKLIKRESM